MKWWVLTLALLLVACERQANRLLDQNPAYAGKADVHADFPGRDAVLRRRVLTVQTDR